MSFGVSAEKSGKRNHRGKIARIEAAAAFGAGTERSFWTLWRGRYTRKKIVVR